MYAKTVRELLIYQIAIQLATEIESLIKSLPNYWRVKESDQILRSSSSVSANIAEGFSQRFYPKKYIHYLNISLGSSDESQDHLRKLRNKGYLDADVADAYIKRYKSLSIKILKMIKHQETRR